MSATRTTRQGAGDTHPDTAEDPLDYQRGFDPSRVLAISRRDVLSGGPIDVVIVRRVSSMAIRDHKRGSTAMRPAVGRAYNSGILMAGP